ncbi:MAG: proteasome assembly chaperone family protein [Tepidisphaerales bacterium]
MGHAALTIHPDCPKLDSGSMLLAFTGWMDGGEVSTGTVRHLLSNLSAQPIATIDPEPFYIVNFPGSMELAAVFRPFVRYDAGVIAEFERPANTFYCDAARNIVLFLGREPNLRWESFADCVFELARQAGVSRIFFVGSFGGSVPHTREPRLYASVSRPALKKSLGRYGLQWTEYEGPASFATLLLWRAAKLKIDMASIAAEIPAYLQGPNPRSIESVTRRLASILDLSVDMAAMRLASDEWQDQVTRMVDKDADLAEKIRKLEEEYDNRLLDAEP